jgi:hypothetical protein
MGGKGRALWAVALTALAVAAAGPGQAHAAWSAPQEIAGPTPPVSWTDAETAGEGDAAVAWFDGEFPPQPVPLASAPKWPCGRPKAKGKATTSASGTLPLYISLKDGAGPFGSPELIGEGESAEVGLADDGSAVVVWRSGREMYTRFRSPSGELGPAIRIGARVDHFQFDMAPDGSAVLAWVGGKPRTKCRGLRQVYVGAKVFVSTRPPGGSFGAPQRIGRDFPNLLIDAANGGHALVFWEARRGVWAAVRNPGARFGPLRRIKNSAGAYNPPVGAISSDGTAVVLIDGDQSLNTITRAGIRLPGRRFGKARIVPPGHGDFAEIASDGPGSFLIALHLESYPVPGGVDLIGLGPAGYHDHITLIPRSSRMGGRHQVAANDSGAAVVSADEYGGPPSYILGSYRPPGGGMPPPERISAAIPCACLNGSVARMDSSGTATVFWFDESPGSGMFFATNPG